MLRSPETANSRPIISTTIQAGVRWRSTSDTNAAEISSLSAIGSSRVPTVVICPQRRARYPSRRSVAAATRKIASARNSLGTQSSPRHSTRKSCSTKVATRKGTKNMRRMVRVFGKFMRARGIAGSGFLTTRISLDAVAGESPLNRLRDLGIQYAKVVLVTAGDDFGALVQQMDQ